MIKKLIATAVAATLPHCALAVQSSIDFAGNASAFCSFSGVNNGVLAVNPSNTSQIGTGVSGGSPASFTIQYLGTPTVTVEEVQGFATKPNGVNSSDFNYSTSVNSGSSVSYTANNGVLSGTYSGGSADQLSVGMLATVANGQPVPLGSYVATSVITCQ